MILPREWLPVVFEFPEIRPVMSSMISLKFENANSRRPCGAIFFIFHFNKSEFAAYPKLHSRVVQLVFRQFAISCEDSFSYANVVS